MLKEVKEKSKLKNMKNVSLICASMHVYKTSRRNSNQKTMFRQETGSV
jgi:hypothetical protein